MSKYESREIVRLVQTAWRDALAYGEQALAEATTEKDRRRIQGAIKICRRRIEAGGIEARGGTMKRRRFATSTHN